MVGKTKFEPRSENFSVFQHVMPAPNAGYEGEAKESLRTLTREVVEIAPRDENRHIIMEAVFPRETGRTLKDISHELFCRAQPSSSYHIGKPFHAKFFARDILRFRHSIGVENQQITAFQLNRIELVDLTFKETNRWPARR